MNFSAEEVPEKFSPFPLFRCLKTLSLELNFLYFQVDPDTSELPVSLERIILVYYLSSGVSFGFTEEELLSQMIKSRFLPNLKEVIVPSTAVGPDGREVEGSDQLKLWTEKRRELESEEVFKSGKVRLTKADKGCSGE